jgi:hypothetical protein
MRCAALSATHLQACLFEPVVMDVVSWLALENPEAGPALSFLSYDD